jgi:ABC-type glycerol-3-phosphate transport system permease component
MSALNLSGFAARARRPREWSPVRLAIVCVIALVYLYPLLFMVETALKPVADYVRSPAGWTTHVTLSHLKYAWSGTNPGLGHAMLNSLLAVSIGTVLSCAICSAAAFWFLRNKSRVSRLLLGTFGSLWMVPQVVWLIPFFVILNDVGLINNLLVLGVVYGTVWAPLFIWLLWAYFLQGIPGDVLEAAEVDGASMLHQYWRIVLPLSRPALGAVAALTFVYAWGDVILAVVLMQDPSKFTVTLAAGTLVGQFDPGIQASAAAALITIGPSLLVFLVAQKAIVRGITGGFGK